MTAPYVEQQVTVNTPDFTRPEVGLFKRARKRCRDLMCGTDAIHEAGHEYLPKWAGEDDDSYKIRATLTEVYGAFPRCVTAARGLVGAKPPQLPPDAPEAMQEHWKDIDGQGTHGEVFAMRVFEEGLVEGPAFLLIDHPSKGKPGMRLDEYQRLGMRPYWLPVSTDQIVNWRTMKIGGQTVLGMVTIHEEVEEDSGDFGVDCVQQYRTIRRGVVAGTDTVAAREAITFTIWRKRTEGNKEVWFVFDEGEYVGPKRIPLATGYLGRKVTMMVAEPPLSALAELNIGHYRVSSDRRYLMSIVHAPTFVLEGWTEPMASSDMPPGQGQTGSSAEINLGPNAVLKTPPGCIAKWVQAAPNGLDSSKAEKDDLVAQMASMSIAFLAQQRKAAETATAHRINSIAQNATLATGARGLKDLLDDAAEIHGQYLGLDVAVEFTVNTVYDEETLDAQTIAALGQLAKDLNITRGTLLLILQRGNVIPDDIDLEEEAAALDGMARDQQTALADATARARALIAGAGTKAGDGTDTGSQPPEYKIPPVDTGA